ncbi:MAG: LysM peptidoglycan-binding domain-containing protein [Planctomycetota bacterium]|jgi:nucleoid-associated protein YgaU
MGRLEKQIIVGALGLVGLLLAIVVLKGLKPRENSQPLFIDLDAEEPATPPAEDDGESGFKLDDGGFKPLPPIDRDRNRQPKPDTEPVIPRPDTSKVTPPAPPKVGGPRLYTIQKGDILGRIAQEQMGSAKPRYIEELKRANPGVDEQHLIPGETLVIPVITDTAAVDEPAKDLPNDARVHVVGAGDSLWKIADQYYGNGTELGRIVDANRNLLRDGQNSVLSVGMKLVIPR